MKAFAALFLSLLPLSALPAADSPGQVPPTLMTTCGQLLVNQTFSEPLPPFDGKSNGFASGFKGWRYNSERRGGHWDVIDGTFRGVQNPDPTIKHPATASYGFDFKNVVISCEVRLHDVPMEGRAGRAMSIRTTDTKDYVCGMRVTDTDLTIEKCDNDHAGPDKALVLGKKKIPVKLGEWQKVVFEILNDELVATVNGQSLTGQHSLIASEKKSIMFVSGVEGAVRHFKVWEAHPNSAWEKHKATLKAAK